MLDGPPCRRTTTVKNVYVSTQFRVLPFLFINVNIFFTPKGPSFHSTLENGTGSYCVVFIKENQLFDKFVPFIDLSRLMLFFRKLCHSSRLLSWLESLVGWVNRGSTLKSRAFSTSL